MKITISAVIALALPIAAAAQTPSPALDSDTAFAAMDANKDDHVDRAEYRAYVQARFARQTAAMETAFATMDKDGSGQVSTAEAAMVPVIAGAFEGLDADSDGGLSKAELQDALAKAQAIEAAR